MIGRISQGKHLVRAMAALFALGAMALAVALIPSPSAREAEAQEQYDCRGYAICISKATLPASNVAFPFIIDIEEVKYDSLPTVDGATVSGPTTVFLSDGDEVGIELYGRALITEVPVQGWELIDIDCEGTSDYGWRTSGNSLEIFYTIGEPESFLNCTFVNQRTQPLNLGGLFAGQPTPLPTARPAAVAPAATAPTTISPPRTGDAGLK